MLRTISLFAAGAAAGVVADRIAMELKKPAAQQFPWLRRQVNENVNPFLLEHHIAGGARSEIGTLEHVGRRTGARYHTPVHPTLHGDTLFIPAPLGAGSEWARNVQHAGHARLQFHETLYELDRPELIPVADTGFFPPQIAAPFDRMGWRYLRMHVVASAPGAFTIPAPAAESALHAEPSLTEPFEIPIEPRMVDREPVRA
jgi:hypothetical protein